MPLAAILAIVFSIGAAAGGATAYKFQQARVLEMELKINEIGIRSINVFAESKLRVREAELEAVNLNNELENANNQNIKTINHYYDALHTELSKRVRANDKSSCSNSVSKSSSAGSIETATISQTGFSAEYVAMVEDQLKKADEVANYAWTAYKFTSANCGIK